MKKLLSIVAIVVFFAAIAIPAYSSIVLTSTTIQVIDDKPTKKESKTNVEKATTKDCVSTCGEKKAAECAEKKAAAPACGEKEKK